MPRRLTARAVAAAAAALVVSTTIAAAAPMARAAAVPVVVIDGRGWGHGVGMAQDGAYWMARQGATTETILGHFYPGTALARARGGVRVVLSTAPVATTLRFPDGGQVTGRAAMPPGGVARVVTDPAGVRVDDGPPVAEVWAVAPAGSVVESSGDGRRYRGALQLTAAGGALHVVDQLDVEDYLRGMGEVRDGRWPAAALRTQAIAARTYALRAMAASGEICADDRCQVYLGAQAEYPAMDAAVAATRGQVLTFGGTFASAVYSANAGGVSATPAEGFGSDQAYPYLRSLPYPTGDPARWQVRVRLADVASRLGYAGGVDAVRVAAAGPSGRAVIVELDGDAGARSVPALRFASALGLRSTLFTLRLADDGAGPASPPPAPASLQVPPEQVAAVFATAPRRVADATPLAGRRQPLVAPVAAAAVVASTRSRAASLALVALVLVLGLLTSAGVVGRRRLHARQQQRAVEIDGWFPHVDRDDPTFWRHPAFRAAEPPASTRADVAVVPTVVSAIRLARDLQRRRGRRRRRGQSPGGSATSA